MKRKYRQTIKIYSDDKTIEHHSIKTPPITVDDPFEINLHATLKKGVPFISGTQNCEPREFATILAVWIIITMKRFGLDAVDFTERLAQAVLQIQVKKGIAPDNE